MPSVIWWVAVTSLWSAYIPLAFLSLWYPDTVGPSRNLPPLVYSWWLLLQPLNKQRHGNCNLRAIHSICLCRRWHNGLYQSKNDGMEGERAGEREGEGSGGAEGADCQNHPTWFRKYPGTPSAAVLQEPSSGWGNFLIPGPTTGIQDW